MHAEAFTKYSVRDASAEDEDGAAIPANRATAARKRRTTTRAKEDAELRRATATIAQIPSLKATPTAASGPLRPNRRQRAEQQRHADERSQGLSNTVSISTPKGAANLLAVKWFRDLPISSRSKDGLARARFDTLTPIQVAAIPQALAGRDVLAAAPTGSGKTLAFLIPLLETLWREKWSTFDGLGAIVLVPTRELALQIFEVLRKVAQFHMISAGLVIGGKDFEYEREKVGQMNVLVATPGRLLHHMDHVADLDCTGLKVLVLDEADRILDMGFAPTLDAILENLPKRSRQTLLFSATQTKSVKSLARLSLQSPEYVSIMSPNTPHAIGQEVSQKGDKATDKPSTASAPENSQKDSKFNFVGTPTGLSQSYALVAPEDKLSVLWSFIRTHLKAKIIVFLSTGKQVRFVFNSFCKLRPGTPLLHMHGAMKQLKRTEMYDTFCKTNCAVLFATDVASRGLDFPRVDWVVQVDCPDDVASYVHRVGRTARFNTSGRAMLFLSPGPEEVFLKRLEKKNLKLHNLRINPARTTPITPKLAALVASNQELKNLSQRAFTFYLKSVSRQLDKAVFDVTQLDYKALALSYGMATAPSVRFGKDAIQSRAHSADVPDDPADADDEELASRSAGAQQSSRTVFGYRKHKEGRGGISEDGEESKIDGSVERARERPNAKASAPGALAEQTVDEDDVLVLKRVHDADDTSIDENRSSDEALNPDSAVTTRKRKRIKLDLLRAGPSAHRIVFTDDGRAVRADQLAAEEDSSSSGENAGPATTGSGEASEPQSINEYAAVVSSRLRKTEKEDKEREHERVRGKHAKMREKLRVQTQRREPGRTGNSTEDHRATDASESSDEETGDENDGFAAALKKIAARGRDDDEEAGVRGDASEDDSEDGGADPSYESADDQSDGLDADEQMALRILRARDSTLGV